MITFLIGLFVGGAIGVMCMAVVSYGRSDKEDSATLDHKEEHNDEQKDYSD